jgi:hypothetical protein
MEPSWRELTPGTVPAAIAAGVEVQGGISVPGGGGGQVQGLARAEGRLQEDEGMEVEDVEERRVLVEELEEEERMAERLGPRGGDQSWEPG